MSLVGVSRMDDGIGERKGRSGSERKVINVEAGVVEAVNDYAEELEETLGFRPTFSQALCYIVKELRRK